MTDPAVASANDRNDVVELLARYASMPDTMDWDELPLTVFAEQVTWDFQSAGGPPPVESPRAELISHIRVCFYGFAATHHAITNHRVTVDGDTAHVRAHIHAEHWVTPELAAGGPNCWLVVGFYDDDAVRTPDGWRLQRVKLTVRHQENGHLFPIALAEGQRVLGL
jgi:3-phenylpropionate/cinnamic acid dioxygenase small subunit